MAAIQLLGLPPRNENKCPHKDLDAKAHSAPNWKQSKRPSIGQWINCGISNQWNANTCNNTDKSQKHDVMGKKSDIKHHVMYEFV